MSNEKVRVSLQSSYELLHPMHTVLLSCVGREGKPNIITLAWAMPVSINPPLIAVSVAPERYSHSLIEETGEFVINIPTMDILDEVYFCGTVSGRTHNKFKEAKLTPIQSRRVRAPAIKECVAHLECRVYGRMTAGDHTIFVGEVLEAYADREAYNGWYNLEKAKMVFHLGGDKFATLEPRIYRPKPFK